MEALKLLHGEGAILDVAREVSRLMRDHSIDGAVIGGVAVLLHGHVRTTLDVDVYAPQPVDDLANLLTANGFAHDETRREFRKKDVPVHLVLADQTRYEPRAFEDRDQIRTVSLPDLINMKLRSGLRSVTRAQDLADVIGLIRARNLTTRFATRLNRDLRPDFRRLVQAIRDEQP